MAVLCLETGPLTGFELLDQAGRVTSEPQESVSITPDLGLQTCTIISRLFFLKNVMSGYGAQVLM